MSNQTGMYKSNNTQTTKAPVIREAYNLGDSNTKYELANNLVGKVSLDKVKSLFCNEKMYIAQTEGRSLKVMFATGTEVKFLGFITAGDASIELSEEDVPAIMAAITQGGIHKAITNDELIDLF